MNLWARPLRVFVLILVGLIVGCVASRQPVRPPSPPREPVLVLPMPATAMRAGPVVGPPVGARTNKLVKPTTMAIPCTPTNSPDTTGATLFIIYSTTNLINPNWRYMTDTYSTNVVVSITNKPMEFFYVEKAKLALGVKIQPK